MGQDVDSSVAEGAPARRLPGLECDQKALAVGHAGLPRDHAEMTANAASMVALEILCLKAWARGARPEGMSCEDSPLTPTDP